MDANETGNTDNLPEPRGVEPGESLPTTLGPIRRPYVSEDEEIWDTPKY